jgi:predicted transcriptional regulator
MSIKKSMEANWSGRDFVALDNTFRVVAWGSTASLAQTRAIAAGCSFPHILQGALYKRLQAGDFNVEPPISMGCQVRHRHTCAICDADGPVVLEKSPYTLAEVPEGMRPEDLEIWIVHKRAGGSSKK